MTEEWRDVPGAVGYQASSLGRIKGRTGKILNCTSKRSGTDVYKAFMVGHAEGVMCVHIAVAAAFLGDRPDGLQVCHNDGNPHNNAVTNLRYDTARSNHLDAVRHGTKSSKLTDDDIREIRTLRGIVTYRDLAARYGVSSSLISQIYSGRRWAHVKDLPENS